VTKQSNSNPSPDAAQDRRPGAAGGTVGLLRKRKIPLRMSAEDVQRLRAYLGVTDGGGWKPSARVTRVVTHGATIIVVVPVSRIHLRPGSIVVEGLGRVPADLESPVLPPGFKVLSAEFRFRGATSSLLVEMRQSALPKVARSKRAGASGVITESRESRAIAGTGSESEPGSASRQVDQSARPASTNGARLTVPKRQPRAASRAALPPAPKKKAKKRKAKKKRGASVGGPWGGRSYQGPLVFNAGSPGLGKKR